MSRIVRFDGFGHPIGAPYGYLGETHPTLSQYVHVDWIGGKPSAGYYPRSSLRVLGTAFVEREPASAGPVQ
ncbi:MAG: hypothetical protein WC718_01365 [Phycisphaerales bacterium]|jgi:hypothetical protein